MGDIPGVGELLSFCDDFWDVVFYTKKLLFVIYYTAVDTLSFERNGFYWKNLGSTRGGGGEPREFIVDMLLC